MLNREQGFVGEGSFGIVWHLGGGRGQLFGIKSNGEYWREKKVKLNTG
jgi:hypothetical protein